MNENFRRFLFALSLLGFVLAGLAQELPPGPEAVYRTSFEVTEVPEEPFEVINIILEFAPGAWTPMHTHGGLGLVTVLEGTLSRKTLEGEEATFAPGESWLETGEVEAAGNDTDSPVRVLFTIMLPKGAQVTIPHEE